MRVVTLDWTRLSLLAARTTPPSATTVRKIFKLSRSNVLMARTVFHNYSFVQAVRASHMPTDATRAPRPRAPAHALRHGCLYHGRRCAGGRDGHRPVRLHAAPAADGARRFAAAEGRRLAGGQQLPGL